MSRTARARACVFALCLSITDVADNRAATSTTEQSANRGKSAPTTVLFMCPHGAAKSVLASAYFQQAATERGLNVRVVSAGTDPDPQVAPTVAAHLKKNGYEVPVSKPRRATTEDMANADVVISIGCDLKSLPPPRGTVVTWDDVPSPSENIAAADARIRERVMALIDELASGYVIRGRVVDSLQLRPEDATLMLGQQDAQSFSSTPVKIGADGSFATPRVKAGRYVLEVVRTPHSAAKPAAVVGFSLVDVGTSDVANVVVTIRRDASITGTFRMESSQPAAAWPPHIVVNAYLAFDGSPLLHGVVAEGAQGGRFVLRNAFGPRVLRCGYTLAPGSRWWPSRIMLNGVDVTNVPTDFSAHENAKLEVVFTQQPARIEGTVTDARGEAVRAPWILAVSAERSLWQHWATTSEVAQGDTMGKFSFAALPGRYLLVAVPQTTFDSWSTARRQIVRFASEGVPVNLDEGGRATVNLTLRERQ